MARGRARRPVDVFIVNRVTGEKLPCELSYRGVNDDGLHEWAVATPFDSATEKLTIGMLPARTTVVAFAVIREEGDQGRES